MKTKLLKISGHLLLYLCIAPWAFANSPDDVRPTPEERLIEAGIDPSLPSMIAILADSSIDSSTRYWCAIGLGRTKDRAAIPTLRLMLAEPEPDIRGAAVFSLGELKDRTSDQHIGRLLEEDSDQGVRLRAVQTLSKLRTDTAIEALAARVRDANEPVESIRLNAAFALGRIDSPDAIRHFRASLTDSDIAVRTASAISLGLLEEPASIPYLTDAALDPFMEDWLRTKAIHSLENVTSENFGYDDPDYPPFNDAEREAKRKEALNRIRHWWKKNESQFYEN